MEKRNLHRLLHHKQRLLHHKQGCLIQKILKWLPVGSLLRFKAVCKSWRDLIQSRSFIDLHTSITNFNSSSSSSKFGSFILQVVFDRPDSSSSSNGRHALLMLSHPSDSDQLLIMRSHSGSNADQEEEVAVDDLRYNMDTKEIVGSCNGLVCIHEHNRERNHGLIPRPDKVSLWNPATGQGMTLPQPITFHGAVTSMVVFGFDVETKDYKVVRFTWLFPRFNGNGSVYCFCRVQLYSSSTNSWRLLEGIPCLPGYPFEYTDSVVYLNGTCFFLAHFFYTESYPCLAENNRFIISFDFTKEIITPIQLPDHHRNQKLYLCSLGDKIALFISPNPQYFNYDAHLFNCEDFSIWVLNYERSSSVNKKSWTKLHSFQIQLKNLEWGHEWYIPTGISNDGKFALLASEYGEKMNLYNFATKEVKREFLDCRKVKSKAHAYKPSLVSVIGGNGAGSSSREQQQPSHRWKWCRAAAADRVIGNSNTNR